MRVVLTDVTFMHGARICIAGWDIDNSCMVRPLLSGSHWTTNDVVRNGLFTGRVVEFQRNPAGNPGDYPHRTEDAFVARDFNVVGQMSDAEVHQLISGALTNNLDRYFQFDTHAAKRYVVDGKHVPSLGGIVVPSRVLRFWEDQWQDRRKLRCRVSLPGIQIFDFPVTSLYVREEWRIGRLPALEHTIANRDQVHLRVGLARGLPRNGQMVCYAQLNNMLMF